MSFSSRKKSIFPPIALAIMVLGVASKPAGAATVSTTFGVSATVQATCLVSATPLAFGVYTGVLSTSTSTVSVTCTDTTTYNVSFNAGLATGATVATRKMAGPATALLSYDMYRDAARTQNWGMTVGSNTVAGTGNGAAQALTVYGQISAGQYISPGAYADTITATVTY